MLFMFNIRKIQVFLKEKSYVNIKIDKEEMPDHDLFNNCFANITDHFLRDTRVNSTASLSKVLFHTRIKKKNHLT